MWQPRYTETLYPSFHEHPPLGFIIQSIFFKVLGDHFWVERLYSFITALISAFLIKRIWIHITGDSQAAFVPVLLWMITPVIYWSYSNNLLENTVTVFALAGTLYAVVAVQKKSFVLLLAAAFFIFLANLIKGFVPLFTILVPLCFTLFIEQRNWKKGIYYSFALALLIFIFFFLLTLYPPAKSNLVAYINRQIIPSLSGSGSNTGDRIFIIKALLSQLIVMAGLMAVIKFFFKIKNKKVNTDRVWFFLMIGLSASLPLMISKKQMNHYLVPSIPFFALAASTLLQPQFNKLIEWFTATKKRSSILVITSTVLLFTSLTTLAFLFNRYGRDREILTDLEQFSSSIPENSILSSSPELIENWAVQAYLARNLKVSLTNSEGQEFYLKDNLSSKKVPEGYIKVPLSTNRFELFKK